LGAWESERALGLALGLALVWVSLALVKALAFHLQELVELDQTEVEASDQTEASGQMEECPVSGVSLLPSSRVEYLVEANRP
jgi:hypothetical protein